MRPEVETPLATKTMKPLVIMPGETIQISIIGIDNPSTGPTRTAERGEWESHGVLRTFVITHGLRMHDAKAGMVEDEFGTYANERQDIAELIHGLRRDGVTDDEAMRVVRKEMSTWQNGSLDQEQIRSFSRGFMAEINAYAEKHFPLDPIE